MTHLEQVRNGISLLLFAILTAWSSAQSSPASSNSWKDVEQAMGRPGQPQPGDVIRFPMPRKDLNVTLNGLTIKPGLALGSWVAFMRHGDEAMVMGALVLTDDEVAPIIATLQKAGVQEAALHNHLLGESPHVMYMHLATHGDPVHIAKAIHDAVALTKTPPPDSAPPAADLGLDQAHVEQAI